jgi:hypothetical protein
MAISKLNPSAGGIPFGNTAGRPTAATGKLYSNGETARLELYTAAGAWENIVQEVPGVSGISGTYSESANSGTITIAGTNFVSGAIASATGTNGVEIQASSTTFNSLVQLSAVFTGLSNANEPYDIKVTNPSNLFGMLPDALYVNASPVWSTSSGSLGTFAEQVSMSVSATATDDSTITYSLASGSSLPTGVTLNSSTGLISGTPPDVASNTTYTFTINASDGLNTVVPRTFSFVSNAAPVWVTSAGTLGTFDEQVSITLSALSATDSSDTVTYALASGSSLPSGVTLNSSTGVISGTLPGIASDTTYTFTINALDGLSTVPRTFSISSTAFPVLETGLQLFWDASSTNSYAGSGNSIYNIKPGGSAHTGTLNDGVLFGGSGLSSYLQFDGSNDDVSNSSYTGFTSGVGTLSIWVYPISSVNSGLNYVASVGQAGTGLARCIAWNGSSSQWAYIGYGGGAEDQNGIGTVSFNNWQQISVVFNGTSIKYYIGTTEYSYTKNTNSPTGGSTILGQALWSTSGENSNMRVGSFAIYNTALSSADIASNYNALKGRYGL